MNAQSPELVRNSGLVMLLTLVLAGGSLFLRPSMLFDPLVQNVDSVPKRIGFWVGTDVDPGPSARFLPRSKVLMRKYHDLAGGEFILTIVCGSDLADMHRPEYCLEGAGWRTESSETVEINPKSGKSFRARLLRVRAPNSRRLACLYWFAGPSGGTDLLAERKWSVLRRALLTGQLEPTAMVRLTMPLGTDPNVTNDEIVMFGAALESRLGPILARNMGS